MIAPRPVFIPGAIAGQATSRPHQAAIVTPECIVTYGQLLASARAVSAELTKAGVGPEVRVAGCLPQGASLAATILGIWLAGGAYVAVDPGGPPLRRQFMLADSGASVVVGDVAAEAELAVVAAPPDWPALAGEPAGQRAVAGLGPVEASDLAYVLYTSGSTGSPKGVEVEHGSLAAMAAAHEEAIYRRWAPGASRIAMNNVPTSDAYFSDYVNLAFGRTLHVVPAQARSDAELMGEFIRFSGVEVLDATPTQARTLLLAGQAPALRKLRMLLLGGEPVDADLWADLRELGDVQVLNLYGPTECTVDVTCALVGDHAAPVIGTAMPGSGVWVLRDDLSEAAVGELGELWVSGPQVARGYTASRAETPSGFTTARLAGAREPARIYRTGDRCRRDASGVLEFCGRDDHQVMLNGYRIEFGEVVSALRACPGVLDATAELRSGDGGLERALVAQVVLADGGSIPAIRHELSLRIPRHMIPALLSVPVLGQPADQPAEPPAEASADQDDGSSVRALVAGLWQQILGVDDVSEEADFFELGGDSQLATRLVVSLRGSLLPDLPIRVIFENPDFDGFCSALEAIARDAERVVKAGP